MKEGWDYKTIGEVIDHLRTGLNPRTHFKLNTPDAEGYYITVRELKGFAIEPDEKTDKVNRAAIKRINERSNLKIGDVLFSGTGTIGKTALVSELPVNWNIKEGVYAMTPKHSELNSKYFIYYIGSDLFLRLVNDKAAGTGVRSIPMKELVKLPISIPSLSEQQSIVDYLDSAFAKIDAMKANAEKALNEAKALFQSSLKEMLEPKEGWKENVFGDLVVSNIVGLTRGKVEQGYEKKYPYLKMNNISPNNTLCWDDLICVDATEEELEKYCLQEGDFLFNTRNSKEWVGKSTVYRDYDAPVMLYNNNVMRIRFVDTINPVFVAYSFLADYTKDQLEKIKSGTTNVWAIYYRDLSKILLTYPLLSEQQSIVETLDSLKSKVDRLQANYDKISQECDALKQAILRQVFE